MNKSWQKKAQRPCVNRYVYVRRGYRDIRTRGVMRQRDKWVWSCFREEELQGAGAARGQGATHRCAPEPSRAVWLQSVGVCVCVCPIQDSSHQLLCSSSSGNRLPSQSSGISREPKMEIASELPQLWSLEEGQSPGIPIEPVFCFQGSVLAQGWLGVW